MPKKLYPVPGGLLLVLALQVSSIGCDIHQSPTLPPERQNEPLPLTQAPAPGPTIPTPAPTAQNTPAPSPVLPEPAPAQKMWPGPNEVWIWGGEYRPSKITVPVGTTVTWTGIDVEEHDVESETGLFLGNIVQGVSFNYTFAERGVFPYHCNYGCIEGVVIVE